MPKKTTQVAKPEFQKTDVTCLYRYSSNGVYYALVKHEGKQKRQSLQTSDKNVAKRKLADLQRDIGKVDSSQGRITLRELSNRYLATVGGLSSKTIAGKARVIKYLLGDFALGADCQVAKIKPSDLQAWMGAYKLGYASHNHYVQTLRGLFDLAASDKIIIDSPAKNGSVPWVVKISWRLVGLMREHEGILNLKPTNHHDYRKTEGSLFARRRT